MKTNTIILLLIATQAWAGNDPLVFQSWEDFYMFVAPVVHLQPTTSVVVKLQNESTSKEFNIPEIGLVKIIMANYYGESGHNRIRGAQLNGLYFVTAVSTNTTIRLIGVLHGNGYRWDTNSATPRLFDSWHFSASEHGDTQYTWNGTMFEPFQLGDK